MKYQRFEDLPVWQAGMDLAERIELLARKGAFSSKGDLCNQVCRASLSVPTNIAEGFESGTTAQLLTSLYIARGSAGETRSLLRYADRLLEARLRGTGATAGRQTEPANRKRADANVKPSGAASEIASLIPLAESCSRQIRGWAESLQNTDIKGQRYLTEKERQVYDSSRRAEVFMKQVDAVVRRRLDEQACENET